MKNWKLNIKNLNGFWLVIGDKMKKVKFESKKYITNFVEEGTAGLYVVPKKVIDNGTIEAQVLETRKTKYKLLLPDGNVIFKKKSQVEIV